MAFLGDWSSAIGMVTSGFYGSRRTTPSVQTEGTTPKPVKKKVQPKFVGLCDGLNVAHAKLPAEVAAKVQDQLLAFNQKAITIQVQIYKLNQAEKQKQKAADDAQRRQNDVSRKSAELSALTDEHQKKTTELTSSATSFNQMTIQQLEKALADLSEIGSEAGAHMCMLKTMVEQLLIEKKRETMDRRVTELEKLLVENQASHVEAEKYYTAAVESLEAQFGML